MSCGVLVQNLEWSPKNDEIKEVLSNTGWSKLVLKSGTIKKLNPKLN